MATGTSEEGLMNYLEFQAYVGITKHNGGYRATDELLSLCRIEAAREVLNVGCGIGVGSTYIARKHGCRVVGVDISEKMIEWSRLRAKEDRVEHKVEFRTADVLELPFEAARFELVFCESVLGFVKDKQRAIHECVRVTKPGGYVGLNETFWTKEPSPEVTLRARASLGVDIPTAATWQALWEESGLEDRVVRLFRITPRQEVRDRLHWVGSRWSIRALGRLFRLYLSSPAIRRSLREMFETPSEVLQKMGYGLFAGRK